MTILTTPANTEPTTPRGGEKWLYVYPYLSSVRDIGLESVSWLPSETSSLKEQRSRSGSFEGKPLSSSASEESEERADIQWKVWEAFLKSLPEISASPSFRTEIRERLTTAPLFPSFLFGRIGVSESHFSFSEILSAIDAEPVEDGHWHPAEKLLRLSLIEHPQETKSWLHNIISRENNASIVASILKCLGRVEPDICNDWGFNLIGTALEHPDVEVRDATVQVLESWGTEKAILLLRDHRDREQVVWLKSYTERVIHDLEGSWELSHGSRC